MVNIREHVSWVHEDQAAATRKAKDLVRAAISAGPLAQSAGAKRVPINPAVLVVGGGIAGIHAALTLANAGKKVYLVEREPTIGGHMAMFDKTFPTLDCAACILTPKMSAVKSHPNITLWTYSEVVKVEGYVGNYQVTVKRKPRYVMEELCVGCLECIEACIYKEARFPDEFNLGLSKRKPVYIPFPQATPQVVLIDPETCIEFKSGKCKKTCVEKPATARRSTSSRRRRRKSSRSAPIILATGFQASMRPATPYYGYGKYPNVYTSLEVERLVNASGPDGRRGRPARRQDAEGGRHHPLRGLARREHQPLVLARLLHVLAEARAPYEGAHRRRGLQLLHRHAHPRQGLRGVLRQAAEGRRPLHPRPRGRGDRLGDQPAEEGKLVIRVEDTLIGVVRRIPVDMVVLSVGLEPQADAQEVRRMFNISCSTEGFFLERHPKLAPVNTFTDGVFIAGACQGPKDIPDTVAQAGAAAAEALALSTSGHVELEPNTAYMIEEECSGCKSCVPLCPYRRSRSARQEEGLHQRGAVQRLRHLRGRLPVRLDTAEPLRGRGDLQRDRRFTATGGTRRCLRVMQWEPRIVAFFCNWCTYTAADLAGVSRMKYAPNVRIIRVMCSGRVDPQFVLDAFAQGADGVLIGGCHPGDCHYAEGNYKALRRVRMLKRMLARDGDRGGAVPAGVDLGARRATRCRR